MGKNSSGLSGGGLESNKVRHTQNPKVEPNPKIVGPGYVSRLGQAQYPGSERAPKNGYEGRGYASSVTVRPATGQGPGSNHEPALKSGSQGMHGSAVSPPSRPGAGKDLLSQFGPERRR
jgi:hypothetical protein